MEKNNAPFDQNLPQEAAQTPDVQEVQTPSPETAAQPETAPQETAPHKPLSEKRKQALVLYMAILFAVAFLLVLLSALQQARSNEMTISELNAANASAMANAETLQDKNRELQEQNNTLQAQNQKLEEALTQSEESATAAKIDADAVQTATVRAYELLLQAQTAWEQEDYDTFAKRMKSLQSLSQHLSDSGKQTYEALQLHLPQTGV